MSSLRVLVATSPAGMVVSHQGRGTFVAATGVTASRNDLLATIEGALVSVARRAQDAGVTRPEWEAMVGRAWE